MKIMRLIISFFLIVGYLTGLTNNLMPRCESESAHQDHIVSIHTNHFHGSENSNPDIEHIGHEAHDETSIINILQHIFDDLENPKEKCESGFFASVHNSNHDVKSLGFIAVMQVPDFFVPVIDKTNNNLEYVTPNYAPPEQKYQQDRGPPFFLV